MKFGKHFRHNKIPEWSEYYFDYQVFKQYIKKKKRRSKARKRTTTFDGKGVGDLHLGVKADSHRQELLDSHADTEASDTVLELLEENIGRVVNFYIQKKQELQRQLQDLKARFKKHTNRSKSDSHHKDKAIEASTSWIRAFAEPYIETEWLENYCQLNNLAIRKMIKKLRKNFPHLETDFEAILDDERILQLKSKAFQTLEVLRWEIVTEISDHFFNGDKRRATSVLKRKLEYVRPIDMVGLGFGVGLIIGIFVCILGLILIQRNQEELEYFSINSSFAVYRFSVSGIFLLLLAAQVIFIYDRFGINWVYIFEVDSDHVLSHRQILKCGVWLLLGESILLLLDIVKIKLDIFSFEFPVFSLILFIGIFFILIMPFRVFYRSIRYSILQAAWEIVIAPFGKLRFRHFFLADIFCSLVKPFQDVYNSICYYSSEDWHLHSLESCPDSAKILFALSFLPYWFRFMQCWRKYYDTKSKFPHVANAMKYFSGIIVVIASLTVQLTGALGSLWYLWIIIYVIATMYMYLWDLFMDWDMFRYDPNSLLKLRMRSHRIYPKHYYIFASVTNLILRFFWVMTLFPIRILDIRSMDKGLLVLILSVAEIYRRAQWAIFRVENECINNYEKFRTIDDVPMAKSYMSRNFSLNNFNKLD